MEKVLRVEDGKYVTGEVIGAEVELMKLLWENPTPSAAFAAQTIAMDLSEYDSIYIVYRLNGSEEICCSGICVKGKNFKIGMNSGTDANTTYGTYGIWREVIASQNGVTFQSAYYVYTGIKKTANNNFCIPIVIYGIKNKIQTIANDVATTADKCIMSSGKSVEETVDGINSDLTELVTISRKHYNVQFSSGIGYVDDPDVTSNSAVIVNGFNDNVTYHIGIFNDPGSGGFQVCACSITTGTYYTGTITVRYTLINVKQPTT